MNPAVASGAVRARTGLGSTARPSTAARGMTAGMATCSGMVYLTARRHVDYGRVRSAMCPA